jgi:NADH dehydrogenase (ubiquinone) 1 alpha subcomplex subunit 6
MRQEFEKNRYLQNLDVINVSLMKGIMELEEMLYMWKTPSHMMKYFKEPQEIKQEFQKIDFLSSFYLNK